MGKHNGIDILYPLRLKYGPENYFELGYKDPILKKGLWCFSYQNISDLDPHAKDPPVPNSQVSVRVGGDSSQDPGEEIAYRYMGMNMDEWRYKVLYRQNPAIKHIYDNWDISPEHPGMQFRNGLRSAFQYLHLQGNVGGVGKLWYYRLMPGGRYYDDPEGEQCFRKAFACSKTCLAAVVPAFIYDLIAGTQTTGLKNQFKHFLRMAYLPVGAGYMWGAAACLACSIRKEDDLINYVWGTVAASTVIGYRLGLRGGVMCGFWINAATMTWRLTRDCWEGPLGFNDKFSTNLADPTSWKWAKWHTTYADGPYEMNY